ncbi:hypothetical protein [Actinoplanes sp. HUAS TT8]|uniref:hypothetical protein n=1 Tax=Actinoplanes sp. HUAS TT8 TaxID=3447453 RepID=UPI003F525FB3
MPVLVSRILSRLAVTVTRPDLILRATGLVSGWSRTCHDALVSVLTDYFAAPSDGVAATAVDGQPRLLDLTPEDVAAGKALYRMSPDEALRPQVKIAQSGTLVVQSKGVDSTRLARLEQILTGRPDDEVKADPRQAALVAPAEEDIDGCLVLSVSDTVRDALASLEPAAQPQVARQWADAEFDAASAESLTMLLGALAELAQRAVAENNRLYCYVAF